MEKQEPFFMPNLREYVHYDSSKLGSEAVLNFDDNFLVEAILQMRSVMNMPDVKKSDRNLSPPR